MGDLQESGFSGEVSEAMPAQYAPPTISGAAVTGPGEVTLQVTLPTTDTNNNPLAAPPSEVVVYYKQTTFVSTSPAAEDAAGTPKVTVAAVSPETPVKVDGLSPGATYYFVAAVS
jgi:hypothetical protein